MELFSSVSTTNVFCTVNTRDETSSPMPPTKRISTMKKMALPQVRVESTSSLTLDNPKSSTGRFSATLRMKRAIFSLAVSAAVDVDPIWASNSAMYWRRSLTAYSLSITVLPITYCTNSPWLCRSLCAIPYSIEWPTKSTSIRNKPPLTSPMIQPVSSE